ncbi:MAG: efflux RND transporter permease subunit [Candidatus Eisenbacteria sp.]|nr:efflux RND transporter permease subunit [Candidatus Eisenbacteria bacterium]
MKTNDARGPIAWMARNHVTANVLMMVLLVGGLFTTTRIKQEVFPEFSLDMVSVSVAYPGASPEEVEQGIVLAVEEAIRGIDEIKEVEATAREGMGIVNAELHTGVDAQKAYQEIDQEVARIVTFPRDAEEPQVKLESRRRRVRELTLYGEIDELVLRELAEEVRDRLLQSPGITQVDLLGVRRLEIHVEIPQENLRAYGLTLEGVANTISASALELPGGSIRTDGGEILLRVTERRDWAEEFAELPLITTATGSRLRLGEIGRVREGFEETNIERQFKGLPCVSIEVYSTANQTPGGVADAVDEILVDIRAALPPGVAIAITNDMADMYAQRLTLLLKNAFIGLVLVLILLGLFLDLRLAFWVTMGIPISFLGGLLFLPWLGVTINMVSMFAFIVALGIVVDDAIVAGENIYEYRQRGMGFLPAAIQGARDVAVPITYAILTNIVAFLPLAFIPGVMGKIWISIPIVVITVFVISWVEALFILPAHLTDAGRRRRGRIERWIAARQTRFAEGLQRFIRGPYARLLSLSLRNRAVTVAISLAVLMVVLAYAMSGRMGFTLMPRTESDFAIATAVLPYGTPEKSVREVRDEVVAAACRVVAAHGGDRLSTGILTAVNENQVEITVYLTDPDERPISTSQFSRQWRQAVGTLSGLERLRFETDRRGIGGGASFTVELAHRDIDVLDQASASLAASLREFSYTRDIDDGYSPGKEQLDFRIRAEGRALGLTASDIARQVRSAFYGAQALRQQRGRNEVRLLVRLPESQRTHAADVEKLLIRTPRGTWVPLMEVAEVGYGHAYTTIARRDGRRTVSVTCNVDPEEQTSTVQTSLMEDGLPQLALNYPGLTYSFQGRQAEMQESLAALAGGFTLAMLAAFALLAIPFRSYSQPLVIMVAIPFGIVGAVFGHLIMGYSLSVMSMMGVVALSGVVINDSLVLIDQANRLRREGATAVEAIQQAGRRRFRPILLTTLTTFGGLAPMIFETSRQARFMIPMALSLGFGILFATVITLLLVPSLYMLLEDLRGLFRRTSGDEYTDVGIAGKGAVPQTG